MQQHHDQCGAQEWDFEYVPATRVKGISVVRCRRCTRWVFYTVTGPPNRIARMVMEVLDDPVIQLP
jgi:hypothetical protein